MSARLPSRRTFAVLFLLRLVAAAMPCAADSFQLPTDNRALLARDGEARFFAPTAGRTWTSGQFGCVRSEGGQMHEGIDILTVKRDRRGEPIDEVRAAADGEVAYLNRQASLSNYGQYLVLRHRLEGLEVYTLYAHLRRLRSDLAPGKAIRRGEVLGILGRTTNTRSPIGRERAHLHFEIDFLVTDHFSAWLQKNDPRTRNDHGSWNGRNLIGIDPAAVFRGQNENGTRFSLLEHVRHQREMFRVLVADTSFPWLRRYPVLIRRNAVAEREGIVAYEVTFNYNGLPFNLVPRSRREVQGPLATRLLNVNEAEVRRSPCRNLVFRKGQAWVLTAHGQELLDMLTF